MSRVCQVTGKRPVTGNNVSHAHNKTRRRFLPNLHTHRFWVASENRFVKLKLSAKGLRIIDKKGIDDVMSKVGRIFSISALKSFGTQKGANKLGNKRHEPWFNCKENFHLAKRIHERSKNQNTNPIKSH